MKHETVCFVVGDLLNLKHDFITLIIFLSIDAFWLGLVAPKFYCSQIGHLMAETPNLLATGVFFLFFVGALVYFVVAPAVGGAGCGIFS